MAIVKVTNLKKAYGDFYAVNDISFEIQAGEIFGFLGPNGAGKTSTINILIGLSRPSGGQIEIHGIDVIKETKKAQSIIGVVPDESNLYDEMNGFDNLCFCASLYGIGKEEREKRAKDLLKLFELDGVAERPFKHYSKGMRRKLTIAAGIIHNPKILFLDEPTTGIDVESAMQIRDLILALKKEGKTIFLTTHYLEEAERVCDRIAFIVKGKIVKISTVSELMEEASPDYRIKLKVSGNLHSIRDKLDNEFDDARMEILDETSCLFISKEELSLYPIIESLNKKGIAVYEAKEIKPSLEDIFVKITGIGKSNGRVVKDK
ncbi:MAG: ABC transporter ATP-binding protein [Tissierellaceae bacterium]|jgi:ABC-2 type transport system ATP-binding protein|nr:ABC transporter ATP-binding protein [Tissierellia bacterium]